MRRCTSKLLVFASLWTSLTIFVMVVLNQNAVNLSRFVPKTGFYENCKNCRTAAPNTTNLMPVTETCTGCKKTEPHKTTAQKKNTPDKCNGCSKLINKVLEHYSTNWTEHEENHQSLRSLLITNCNGFQKAIITQANTPVGTKLVFDGEKERVLQVKENIFSTFVKDDPLFNKTLDTCAVVGNGGILANSSCGEAIDSAQFVIRCNLPPLENGYRKHVGNKTNMVTANPSIFWNKHGALKGRRRQFVESLSVYGDALLFIPAFSFGANTDVSLTALYTVEDFRSPVRPVFMNPEYLRRLDSFWRSQGLNPKFRLTTGFMMVSLALEICNNVDVYGFWPFDNHPHGLQPLTNHYFDDKKATSFHAMPAEFAFLVKLHSQGVLKLHLGQCPPQKQ